MASRSRKLNGLYVLGGLTKNERIEVSSLLSTLRAQIVPHKRFAATWSNGFGTLSINREGFETIRTVAKTLKNAQAWKTYPLEYLQSQVAFKYLEHNGNPSNVVESIEAALAEGYGHQDAFVPFWSFHLANGVALDFGSYRLSKLGEIGFEEKILQPFQHFRSAVGAEAFARDLEDVRNSFAHIPSVPVLHITFMGAAKGARDYVDPIALRVGEFLQFLLAKKCAERRNIRIVDHTGAYFGRFTSIMPVLSRNENLEPIALDSPNLRGFPYGGVLDEEDIKEFASDGLLRLLPYVASGPTKGQSVVAMLLRAIQLFSDGERAVSARQAIISYVGACDALFGKKLGSELYTCAGMSAASDGSFQDCKTLYTARSDSAHAGITPIGVNEARMYAWRSITFVARNQDTLRNKKAIRAWIVPYVEKALGKGSR